jgi:hypothetical protein
MLPNVSRRYLNLVYQRCHEWKMSGRRCFGGYMTPITPPVSQVCAGARNGEPLELGVDDDLGFTVSRTLFAITCDSLTAR